MGINEWWQIWNAQCELLDEVVGDSWVGRYFQLKKRKSKFSTELKAGCITFVTMCYILVVNALLLSDTGGPCSVIDCTGPLAGDPTCVFPDANGQTDLGYSSCTLTLRRNLVTATAASSAIGSVLMGLGANLPVAIAPGMGLNAYFAYTLVGYRGTGKVSYESALAAVFIEGWIFVLLSITGLRKRLVTYVPKSIMLAIPSGIGLFLAFVGLQAAEGLGLVAFDASTLVTLGGCPMADQEPTYLLTGPDLGVMTAQPSSSHVCVGHRMENPTVWLGLAGLLLIALLMSRSFKGPIALGMLFVTVIAWIPGHAASYIGAGSPIGGGEQRRAFLERVVAWPNLSLTGGAISFDREAFTKAEFWLALFTFFVVDFLDTSGTLQSMASFINNFVPGFVNDEQKFPRERIAFSIDGMSSVVGSLLGSSPLTAYIDSATGIKAGGRTGITACVVAFWFMVCMFFTPLLATVPPYAVGPALITVGALMMMNVIKIRWEHAADALPCFLTMILMPMTYSITNGVIAGIVGFGLVAAINWLLDHMGRLWSKRRKKDSRDLLPMHSSGAISAINGYVGRTRPPRTPRDPRTPKTGGLHRERSGVFSASEKFLRPSGSAPPFLRSESRGNLPYGDNDLSQRNGQIHLRNNSGASAEGGISNLSGTSTDHMEQGNRGPNLLGPFGSNINGFGGGPVNLNRVSAFDFEEDFVHPGKIRSGSSCARSFTDQDQQRASPSQAANTPAKGATGGLPISSDSAPPLDRSSPWSESTPSIPSVGQPSDSHSDRAPGMPNPFLQRRSSLNEGDKSLPPGQAELREAAVTSTAAAEQGILHETAASARQSGQQAGGAAAMAGEDVTCDPSGRGGASARASNAEAHSSGADEGVAPEASGPSGISQHGGDHTEAQSDGAAQGITAEASGHRGVSKEGDDDAARVGGSAEREDAEDGDSGPDGLTSSLAGRQPLTGSPVGGEKQRRWQ